MTPAVAPASNPPRDHLVAAYRLVALDQLIESGHNPRKHFDQQKLTELAASIREHGILEPLVTREVESLRAPQQFEIIAGARRYRAAKVAGLETVPIIVREYSDEAVLEMMLIENLQRDDLDPLEQAAGFKALIDSNPEKHTPSTIATRVGMSEAWVWDRLKLNDLILPAKELLGAGKMAIGHAILIARQKPGNQERIINPDRGGLFVPLEHGLEFDGDGDPQEKPGKYDDVKAVSVRELEAWIARHIRFDVEHAAKAVPLQFEQTAQRVQAAAAEPGRGKKVIAITFDHMPADDAKDPSERTYGVRSWRRADGTKKSQKTDTYPSRLVDSPTCEHSVLGVVAVGREHYGETFQVCVARDKCRVHWGKAIADREKNAKLRESGQSKKADHRETVAAKKEREAEERQKRLAADWDRLKKQLNPSAKKAAGALKNVKPELFALMLKDHRLPAGTKPADLPAALVRASVEKLFKDWAWVSDRPLMVQWATALGLDVKALEKSASPGSDTGAEKPAAKPRKKGRAA